MNGTPTPANSSEKSTRFCAATAAVPASRPTSAEERSRRRAAESQRSPSVAMSSSPAGAPRSTSGWSHSFSR